MEIIPLFYEIKRQRFGHGKYCGNRQADGTQIRRHLHLHQHNHKNTLNKNFCTELRNCGINYGTENKTCDPAPDALISHDSIKHKTSPEKLRPDINKDKCIGCGICVNVCPANVFELQEKEEITKSGIKNNKKTSIVIHPESCRMCGKCIQKCPQKAINWS
ncbi:MAG: 4Fe-4S binding protein [Bacteroidales bacterium]|jgi:NAD-dependent dihydropyrimidine dehydrogenase PreA subunit|nr:4Fe-4S binding protein [Bacteroidales bacterium]